MIFRAVTDVEECEARRARGRFSAEPGDIERTWRTGQRGRGPQLPDRVHKPVPGHSLRPHLWLHRPHQGVQVWTLVLKPTHFLYV